MAMSNAKLLIFATFFNSAFSPLAQASDCYTFTNDGPGGIGGANFHSPAKTLCISMYVPNQYALLFISDKYAQLGEANCTQKEKSNFNPGATDEESYATVDGKSSVKFSLKNDPKSHHWTGIISIDGKNYGAESH